VNVASESRTIHILAGDATGGGHAWFGSFRSFWNGVTGAKSMFPAFWSNRKIMHGISEVVVSNRWIQRDGIVGSIYTRAGGFAKFSVIGIFEGVKMEVIVRANDIITAYPIR
jgi:hypothetical protein